MDVLRFINSSALREHLKSTDYHFSGFEAAWLVWNCRSATLDDKLAAWDEIARTYPDEEYPNRLPHYGGPPTFLHATLGDYAAYIKRVADFVKEKSAPENFYYCYTYVETAGGKTCGPEGHFLTYEAVLKDALADMSDLEEGASARIFKRAPGSENKECELKIDRNGVIMDADSRGFYFAEGDEEISLCFEDMWFGFPTPFEKGDILYDPERVDPDDLWSGPFVFRESATDISKRFGRPLHDSSDMIAYGIFLDSDDLIYGECMHDYTSLEYFPEEKLTGRLRILRALSGFMKGDIGEVLFANAYAFFITDERAKSMKRIIKKSYTEEGRRLAGLDKE